MEVALREGVTLGVAQTCCDIDLELPQVVSTATALGAPGAVGFVHVQNFAVSPRRLKG